MPHSHSPSVTGRLDGLQLGRALAALTVVIGHAVGHPLQEQASELWQLASRYGVTLFFVISGFIMVQTTGQGRFDPGGFMSRRLRRVVPIYWFVTLLVAATSLVAPSLFRNTIFDLQHLVASLLFIPMYDPADPSSISPLVRLGWTLNFEMFFYAVFTATFAMGLLTRAVALSVFFSVCILVGQSVDFQAAIPAFYTRIDTLGFVAGVWLGVFNLRGIIGASTGILGALIVGSIALLGYIAVDYEVMQPIPVTQVLLVAVCAAHVAMLLIFVDKRGLTTPRPLTYVGDASYSMYLFHMFAVGVGTFIILRLPEAVLVPGIIASALSGIALGLFVYQFLERPLNRRMRHRRPLTAAQISGKAGASPASTGDRHN